MSKREYFNVFQKTPPVGGVNSLTMDSDTNSNSFLSDHSGNNPLVGPAKNQIVAPPDGAKPSTESGRNSNPKAFFGGGGDKSTRGGVENGSSPPNSRSPRRLRGLHNDKKSGGGAEKALSPSRRDYERQQVSGVCVPVSGNSIDSTQHVIVDF